jgi:signal transduction histidine kinase
MDLLNCGWDHARYLIISANVFDPVIYYSHLLPSFVALLTGFYVFLKNKKANLNIALFLLTLIFSTWVYFDLILWASEKPDYIMFFWSLMIPLEYALYVCALYLVSIFVNKKGLGAYKKVIIVILFAPIIFLLSTKYNIESFDYTNCDRGAIEGPLVKYTYIIEVGLLLWIIFESVMAYIKNPDRQFKKQIIFFSSGIVFMLLAFSLGNFTLMFDLGWEYEQYKLFGMPVFLALLAYLIVRYKAFDIKLLSVQALIIALVVLIGSQFFFIKSFTNQVLTGITLAISAGFGWMLIRSVKTEVARKEELQTMTNRLAQANDQLRKLDNAKSEFISIASHQLRTPLTAIKGFISLLLEGSYGKVNSIHREVMNKVYLSNERLIALVEDMLNLSRIESGRMEYNFEKVKIEDVAKEVYDTFAIRSREKGLKLELKLPETPLPEATTDRNKIREVISNLVDNSIKYTLKGWVSIRLSQKDDKIIVAITDTGIGIPQEELPYLFEKFSRGKDISRLNTGGTGLGLHVGKRMIEALHGAIRVESEGEGKGSTFFIEVPIEMEEEK